MVRVINPLMTTREVDYLNSVAEIPMKKPKEKLRLGPLILVLILSIVVGAISIRVNWQIHMREMRNHVGYQFARLAQA